MAAHEKLLERMRRTKSGWGQNDFKRLYEGYGFKERAGGKHAIYSHPVYTGLRATVARHNDLAEGYAQTAIRLVDTVLALEAERGENRDEANDGPDT